VATGSAALGPPSEFAEEVLDLVDRIPSGRVATYGDLAELLGRGGARGVGNVLARYGSDVPWWRVVRAGGGFPQGLEDEALQHYREEGTPLLGGQMAGRRVDLAAARWSGPPHPRD
jgi:alkylated DNA nucleotide flippase Atl1